MLWVETKGVKKGKGCSSRFTKQVIPKETALILVSRA